MMSRRKGLGLLAGVGLTILVMGAGVRPAQGQCFGFYAPAPVYVAPAPVVVAPVYYAPAPVYYSYPTYSYPNYCTYRYYGYPTRCYSYPTYYPRHYSCRPGRGFGFNFGYWH